MKKLLTISFFTLYSLCNGQIITTIAGTGTFGFSGDGGPAISANITGPVGDVLVDNSGNVFFDDQDNARIREINTSGIITTFAGTGVAGYGGDGGPALAAKFDQNTVVGFDSSRNMYVVDYNNNRIRKINTSGIVSTFAGTGVSGYSGNGGAATSAQLNWPCCVISDAAGNIYIADSWNNVIREVNTSGIITLFAGTGVPGYNGDGIAATTAQLNRPFRIIFDKQWNMYVADAFNNRIRKINTSGIISTFAGTGAAGYNGDGIPANTAQLNEPYGVCVDTAGIVYIADSYNNRIREVNSSGTITTLAGTGVGGYGGDGGPANAAQINWPVGVSCRYCNIYVDDWNNYRIRMISNDLKVVASKDTICAGDSVSLIASGATSYLWTPSTGLSCTTCANPIASPTVTTTYTVKCGCATAQIKITVGSLQSVSLTGKDTLCSGTTTTLKASGGTSYFWSTGSTTDTISPTPITTNIYKVKITNGGCSLDTSITVVVNPSPSLTLNQNAYTICGGDTLFFNVTGATTYSWSPTTGLSCTNCPNPIATPTVSTTYIVTGSDAGGCSSTKNINVTVSSPPVLASIPDVTTCSGGVVTLAANVLSGNGGTYTWLPGGSSNPTITVTPNTTTTYTVQYTNGCGTVSTTVTVFVNPIPTPSFSADVTQGCAPLCVQFRDLCATSSKITQWRWAFGNGDTVNEESPAYCYPDTGTFTASLTIVTNTGCSATLQIDQMIKVYSKPVANFTFSPQPVTILAPTVQFTDKSYDAYGIAFWIWGFNDAGDSISNLRNPSHTYHDTGTYCPMLVIENIKGCVDTITECFHVDPIFALYIPDAFTPNGDGLNDVFQPKGVYVKSFEMYIYDRWGMEIFHTKDINQGWNGTMHSGSTIVQEDSYVYKIIATDWSNVQHSYVGQFTLTK